MRKVSLYRRAWPPFGNYVFSSTYRRPRFSTHLIEHHHQHSHSNEFSSFRWQQGQQQQQWQVLQKMQSVSAEEFQHCSVTEASAALPSSSTPNSNLDLSYFGSILKFRSRQGSSDVHSSHAGIVALDLKLWQAVTRRNSSLAAISGFCEGRSEVNLFNGRSRDQCRLLDAEMEEKDNKLDTRGTLEEWRSGKRSQSRNRDASERIGMWSLQMERQFQGFKGHYAAGSNFVSKALIWNNFRANRLYSTDASTPQDPSSPKAPEVVDHSQRAVVVALWCNFFVFALKVGVWVMTSSHVMLAEAVHSLADLANQGLLAYGLMSSRRAPDALHPYGYTKERFIWSLISAVGIFCLGSGATIVHGVQNLWSAQPLENVMLAAGVLGASMLIEGASLVVAFGAVQKGAAAESMTLREYLWRGHDPTAVAVLMEDGAAVLGLGIAGLALAAAEITGNPIWDPIGSVIVGNLLGVVAIFLIQRNRQALLGRSIDDVEMRRVINLLVADPVVEGLYDCKSEVIGPGAYRFKAEIDFNGMVIVQNYLQRTGRGAWMKEFREAAKNPDGSALDRVLAEYGEEVVSALGSEVDRLEKDIQRIVPGILHVDIEAHNPNGPVPREKFYLSAAEEKLE